MYRVIFALLIVFAAGLELKPASATGGGIAEPVSIAPLPLPPLVSLARYSNGDVFFDIEDTAPPATDRAARPRRVRVYWDYSESRADDGLEAERDVLRRYLDSVHPGIIDLVLFSGGTTDVRVVEAPDEAEQLLQILDGLSYEGTASSHQSLDLPLPPADACLYFSDGDVPADPLDAERIRCPLFTLSSTDDANRGFLRVMARRGNGAYLDLAGTNVDDAIAGLTGAAPRIQSVTSSHGRQVEYARLPAAAGRFRIVGPLPASGNIVVTLASGAKRTRTYTMNRTQAVPNDGVGVLWAVDRLHELSARTEPDPERILALARRYSLEAALPTN